MVRHYYGCADIQNKFREILNQPTQVEGIGSQEKSYTLQQNKLYT